MATTRDEGSGWEEWSAQRRRRTWITMAGIAMLFLVGIAQLAILRQLSRRADAIAELVGGFDGLRPFQGVSIVVALASGLAAVLLLRSVIRDRRLVRRVVETDGCVCPRCDRTMSVVATETVAEDLDRRLVRCVRCAIERPAGEIRRYWEQTVASPLWAMEWRRSLIGQGRAERLSVRIGDFAQKHPLLWTLILIPALSIPLILFPIMGGAAPIEVLVQSLPLFVLFAVLAVIAARLGRRFRPDEIRRCAKCRYEQPQTGEVSQLCPECGAEWHRVGGTTVGRRSVWHTGTTLAMVCFLCIMAVFFGARELIVHKARPLMPTALLIASLGSAGMRDAEILLLLEQREVDEANRRRLLTRLIELREAGHRLDDLAVLTLEVAFLDGELDRRPGEEPSDRMRERFVASAIAARIDGPTAARVGDTIRLRIEGEPRSRGVPQVEVRFAFGGWRIGDEPPVHGRDELAPGIRLAPKGAQMRGFEAPSVRLTPNAAGELEITADLWVVLDELRTPLRRVRFGNDGTPRIDEPAPLAMHRHRLVHRLRIDP